MTIASDKVMTTVPQINNYLVVSDVIASTLPMAQTFNGQVKLVQKVESLQNQNVRFAQLQEEFDFKAYKVVKQKIIYSLYVSRVLPKAKTQAANGVSTKVSFNIDYEPVSISNLTFNTTLNITPRDTLGGNLLNINGYQAQGAGNTGISVKSEDCHIQYAYGTDFLLHYIKKISLSFAAQGGASPNLHQEVPNVVMKLYQSVYCSAAYRDWAMIGRREDVFITQHHPLRPFAPNGMSCSIKNPTIQKANMTQNGYNQQYKQTKPDYANAYELAMYWNESKITDINFGATKTTEDGIAANIYQLHLGDLINLNSTFSSEISSIVTTGTFKSIGLTKWVFGNSTFTITSASTVLETGAGKVISGDECAHLKFQISQLPLNACRSFVDAQSTSNWESFKWAPIVVNESGDSVLDASMLICTGDKTGEGAGFAIIFKSEANITRQKTVLAAGTEGKLFAGSYYSFTITDSEKNAFQIQLNHQTAQVLPQMLTRINKGDSRIDTVTLDYNNIPACGYTAMYGYQIKTITKTPLNIAEQLLIITTLPSADGQQINSLFMEASTANPFLASKIENTADPTVLFGSALMFCSGQQSLEKYEDQQFISFDSFAKKTMTEIGAQINYSSGVINPLIQAAKLNNINIQQIPFAMNDFTTYVNKYIYKQANGQAWNFYDKQIGTMRYNTAIACCMDNEEFRPSQVNLNDMSIHTYRADHGVVDFYLNLNFLFICQGIDNAFPFYACSAQTIVIDVEFNNPFNFIYTQVAVPATSIDPLDTNKGYRLLYNRIKTNDILISKDENIHNVLYYTRLAWVPTLMGLVTNYKYYSWIPDNYDIQLSTIKRGSTSEQKVAEISKSQYITKLIQFYVNVDTLASISSVNGDLPNNAIPVYINLFNFDLIDKIQQMTEDQIGDLVGPTSLTGVDKNTEQLGQNSVFHFTPVYSLQMRSDASMIMSDERLYREQMLDAVFMYPSDAEYQMYPGNNMIVWPINPVYYQPANQFPYLMYSPAFAPRIYINVNPKKNQQFDVGVITVIFSINVSYINRHVMLCKFSNNN